MQICVCGMNKRCEVRFLLWDFFRTSIRNEICAKSEIKRLIYILSNHTHLGWKKGFTRKKMLILFRWHNHNCWYRKIINEKRHCIRNICYKGRFHYFKLKPYFSKKRIYTKKNICSIPGLLYGFYKPHTQRTKLTYKLLFQ